MGTPQLDDLPHYTWDDYQNWKGSWEIINGVAYAMSPAPNIKHQEISQKIAHQLGEALKNCYNCKALLPVDWKINEDTVVQPDNSIVCDDTPQEAFLTKAPQVIFEILSPSTAKKDKTTKFHQYESNGVGYYCIVDPEQELVKIYQLLNSKYNLINQGHTFDIIFDLAECKISFNFNLIWP